MTGYEARAYFREKGLTYADISRTDLTYLCALLDLHFVKHRRDRFKSGGFSHWVRTNRPQFYQTATGAMVCATITGKGEYFTARNAVVFDRDGHISFFGEGEGDNARPVMAAFEAWCDAMAEYKAMKKEGEDDEV